MIVESGKRGCVREVMILAAALTIQDPRERPTDKQQLAAEKHARFRDENSDFTGFLNLWNYLQEKQQELSSTAVPPALPRPSSSTTSASGNGRTCSPSSASWPGRWASAWTTSAWPIRWATTRASTSACSRAC